MSRKKQKRKTTGPQRIRLTAQLTVDAYHAVTEIQHQHRIKEGSAIPKWRILDAAIKHYAKAKGVPIEKG